MDDAGLFGDLGIEAPKKYPARGYAANPGTGPDGMRCKDCAHCVRRVSPSGRKHFYKCGEMRHLWTNSHTTDIRVSAAACKYFKNGSETT